MWTQHFESSKRITKEQMESAWKLYHSFIKEGYCIEERLQGRCSVVYVAGNEKHRAFWINLFFVLIVVNGPRNDGDEWLMQSIICINFLQVAAKLGMWLQQWMPIFMKMRMIRSGKGSLRPSKHAH